MDTADSAWVTQLWMGAMVGTESDAGLEFMNTMNPTDYNTPETVSYTHLTCRWRISRWMSCVTSMPCCPSM